MTDYNTELAKLQSEIDERERKKRALEAAQRKDDLATVTALVDRHNFRPEEIFERTYFKDGRKWKGRGPQPRWIKDHLASGGTLDELLEN